MANYLNTTLEEMYRWFDLINQKYHENSLPKPVITIQKTRKGNYGHCTVKKVWASYADRDKENPDESTCCYEINISAQSLDRPVNDLVETLAHECVHLHNNVMGVRDCNGKKHNKHFKELAEKCGMTCEKSDAYGYGLTSPTDELTAFINNVVKPDEKKITYFFFTPPSEPKERKLKVKYTYHCATCNRKFKLKEEFPLICGSCGNPFEVDKEEG